MFRKYASRTYCALLCILLLFISCRRNEPIAPSDSAVSVIVYENDTTEWRVCIVATKRLYDDAVRVAMPDPYILPDKEDAQVLKTCTLKSSERFVTSDGYTFGMPWPSVTKAGAKTYYSVLGLYKRHTIIDCPY